MALPSSMVPVYLKVTGANKVFATPEGAHARITERRLRPKSYAPPKKFKHDVVVSAEHRNGWPVYAVRPANLGSLETLGAVVYLHGGGWVNEIAGPQWQFAAQMAVQAQTTVLVPIYPLIPWGDALTVRDTCLQIVLEAIDEFGSVCMVGDSAGGQISLSVALSLRDIGIDLAHLALISPALDLTWSNPRIADVQPSDPWLAVPGGKVLAEYWRGKLALTDPAVSPLFGNFAELGEVSIYTGTRDVLNPDARLLHDKLQQAGVTSALYELPGQLHVYPLLPTLIGAKARNQIITDLIRGCSIMQPQD